MLKPSLAGCLTARPEAVRIEVFLSLLVGICVFEMAGFNLSVEIFSIFPNSILIL